MRKIGIFLLLMLSLSAWAQERTTEEEKSHSEERTGVFRGYAGGMMLHMGYQYGQGVGFPNAANEETMLRSVTYGIGGALKIHLFKHWKVGAEGYVSTMPVKSQGDGSNIRVGWGGVLNEYYLTWGKIQPFIGGTIGGGAQRATHVYSDNATSEHPSIKEAWESFKDYASSEATYPAQYTKRGMFVLDPCIGADIAATRKLHVVVKADWLIAIHQKQMLTPTGPRLYVGLMFTH